MLIFLVFNYFEFKLKGEFQELTRSFFFRKYFFKISTASRRITRTYDVV